MTFPAVFLLSLIGYTFAFEALVPSQSSRLPSAPPLLRAAVPNPKSPESCLHVKASSPSPDSTRAILLGTLLLSSLPSYAGTPHAANLLEGERIFNANCAACHAGGQNVVLTDHTLQKEAIEKYLVGGFKEASVASQVTHGKNAMPAFGGRLSQEEILNVAGYVIDMAEEGW